LLEAREARASEPRGRGRPARVFVLTEAGRGAFHQAYDDLALGALRFLAEQAGEEAVRDFARARVAELEQRYAPRATGSGRVAELAEALSADGYAAAVRAAPGGALQLCQHHCPVAHVAAEFPQLCEAETEVFARLLGTHVQRLSTIANGDGVCTTHVPTTSPARIPTTKRTFA
ncbi:MAG: transcriptional regulator, partial [Actinomycetota bacterium]|nr:transcriptional regulator [Actinomycetota bacterium]